MNYQIIDFQFPVIFLITITFFLIRKDRSFNPKIRRGFYHILLCALLFIASDLIQANYTEIFSIDVRLIKILLQSILYPLMLLIWLSISIQGQHSFVYKIFVALNALNVILAITSIWTDFYFSSDNGYRANAGDFIPHIIFIATMIALFMITYRSAEQDDSMVYVVTVVIGLFILMAAVIEKVSAVECLMSNSMAVGVSIYYYYLVIKVYKRDAITNLMTRHNLKYDMENMKYKNCSISMIDIDNFKMINDKYGHQKGDEALAVIAKTLRENLRKGCKLYRYGGDEFAIISVGLSDEDLTAMFEKVNESLESKNYRISYGFAQHASGNNLDDTVAEADNVMYENKRRIKSEDIWDAMTGLFNLRGFLDELELLKKKAKLESKNICLVSMDIEHLSNINTVYGYVEGNLVITTVAGIIKNSLDIREFAGHLGSDEFIIALMLDDDSETYQKEVIDRINMGISKSSAFDNKEYTISLHFADYIFNPMKESSMETSVNNALYLKQQKKDNRRKISYTFEDFEEKYIDEQEEALALDIIENNKLSYTMQPIVSAKDGNIVAYEALMCTTTDPKISPLSVLRYATKNNKSYEIERLTYENVLKVIANDPNLPEDAKIFVNSLPGAILRDEDYKRLRATYRQEFRRLVVEITEQSQLTDEDLMTLEKRQKYDRFLIAIDDFGSGNSNTYTLLRYRPQIIKLDRLLISDIERNTKKQYFVNSIITFAKENGMSVLAEGVETEAELKMVLKLQVDYIQGYLTGKPSEVPVKEIDEKIKKIICSENNRGVVEGKRKIYIASSGWETSLVQLALDEYTGITVATSDLKLVGNVDYTADMSIKIKEGIDCNLILQDVKLNAVDDHPCIDIGKGSNLTITLEGNCSLNTKGIRVPEGSSLTVLGTGNLTITTKGSFSYAIGCGMDESIGNISLKHSGNYNIRIDGEYGVAIGGGKYTGGSGINIEGGVFDIYVTAVESVAFGVFEGDVPIRLKNFCVKSEFRVNEGSIIGSRNGKQDVDIQHFRVDVVASGSKIAGIGTNKESSGMVRVYAGVGLISMSGQEINVIGAEKGEVDVRVQNSNISIRGEGSKVLGMGSWDNKAKIYLEETTLEMKINAYKAQAYGATEDNIFLLSNPPLLKINE